MNRDISPDLFDVLYVVSVYHALRGRCSCGCFDIFLSGVDFETVTVDRDARRIREMFSVHPAVTPPCQPLAEEPEFMDRLNDAPTNFADTDYDPAPRAKDGERQELALPTWWGWFLPAVRARAYGLCLKHSLTPNARGPLSVRVRHALQQQAAAGDAVAILTLKEITLRQQTRSQDLLGIIEQSLRIAGGVLPALRQQRAAIDEQIRRAEIALVAPKVIHHGTQPSGGFVS